MTLSNYVIDLRLRQIGAYENVPVVAVMHVLLRGQRDQQIILISCVNIKTKEYTTDTSFGYILHQYFVSQSLASSGW